MRLFIALDLPKSLKEILFLLCEQKKVIEGVNIVSKENYHITLKFLGEVSELMIPPITDKLREITRKFNPFFLKISHSGVFPNSQFPRVVWIGVEDDMTIRKLASAIEESLESLGFKREEKEFKSHITLARVKEPRNGRYFFDLINRRFKELSISHEDFKNSLKFEVKEFVLMKSTLTPKGSIYDVLQRFPLVK